MAIVILMIASAGYLALQVVSGMHTQERAQEAAEAAALAGAMDGDRAARSTALENDARVERAGTVGDAYEVTVVVGGRTAKARAAKGSPGFEGSS